MKNPAIKIGNKIIGKNHPVFIIAEISANHLQQYELAVKTIQAARQAGVDAVKLQTYTADTMTIDCDNDYFQIEQGTIWDGQTFHKLYQTAYTPWEWQPKLQKIAQELGLVFFSSPFDKTAVDFLAKMDVPAYKLASFEITDIPLIEHIASKKKPIIASTGIADKEDIELFFSTCRQAGNHEIIMLKCTSAYPADPEDMNLNAIKTLRKDFDVITGLSDHTLGTEAPIAAVTLGARVIEKHLILDRSLGGPDAAFSLEPDEFKKLVKSIRQTEKMLGDGSYRLSTTQKKSRYFRRSLFVVQDVKKGDPVTEDNIRAIRPGAGLHPLHYHALIGKKFSRDTQKGTPLSMELIQLK